MTAISLSLEDTATPRRLLERLDEAFELRHVDPDKGAELARAVQAEAETRGWKHPACAADVILVYCEAVSPEAEAVLARLEAAFEVCAQNEDAPNQIRAGDILATIYEGIGDFPVALKYAERVYDLCREVGDRLFEGYAVSSLAGIFTATGDFEGAQRKARHGLEIAKAVGNPRLEARLSFRLGRALRLLGDLDGAKQVLEGTRELAVRAEARFIEVDVLTELGRVADEKGELEKAEAYLDEAKARSDDEIWLITGARTLLGLGRIYFRTERLDLAKTALVDLEHVAKGFHMTPVAAEAAALLAEVCERSGEPQEALQALRKHIQLREAIMEGESQRAVKRFQVRTELQAAQREAEQQRLRYAELEAMQSRLLEAERMGAVANLAAGLAHEMNTPLGVVRSNLDTATRALERVRGELGPSLERGAGRALGALEASQGTSRAAVDRLEELVNSFRRFTRLDEAEAQSVDLADSLRETLKVVRPMIRSEVRIELDLEAVPTFLGEPARINQAFLTLLMNAAESIEGEGLVSVSVGEEAGEGVVVIADDGPGLSDGDRERVFEIGFENEGPRTRFRVGLATVRSLVAGYGGRIDCASAPGQGTSFTLRFPLSDG